VKLSGIVLLSVGLLLFSISSPGQTVVEYSTATAAGSTGAAAGGKGVSKSIEGVFGGLDKTLDKLKKSESPKSSSGPSSIIYPSSSSAEATPSVESSAGESPAAATETAKLIRPEKVSIGMARSDLVTKFGKPFMKATRVEGPHYVETYYYKGAEDIVVVTLREGKVTHVSPPPSPEEPKKETST
jgi:hypothetical protein